MKFLDRSVRNKLQHANPALLLVVFLARCLVADEVGSIARQHYEALVRRGLVTGAAFATIDNGRLTNCEFFGEMHTNSLWRAASTSKTLTALAILQLAGRGRIDLDKDVNAYLTTFAVPRFEGRPITVRQLLDHTSGLDDPFVGSAYLAAPSHQQRLSEKMRRYLPHSVYVPGQVRLYSNFGYGILGALIEDVGHVSYEKYMEDEVLQPLGMHDSTFDQPLPARLRQQVVPSIERSVFGTIHPANLLYHLATSAGGLTTSFQDLILLAEFIQSHGSLNGVPVSRIEDYLGLGVKWGQRYWYAGGDLSGYHTIILWFPDQGRALITVAAGAGEMATWGLVPDIIHRWFGNEKTPPRPPGEKAVNPRAVEYSREVAGLYRPVRYPHFDIAKTFAITMDEVVKSEADGSLEYDNQRWLPDAPLHFRQAGGTDELSFQRDPGGRVRFMNKSSEHIEWYQSGRAAIVLYFVFIGLAVCALIIGRRSANTRALRTMAGLILAHSIGWLAAALAADPQRLITGLPWYLQCALSLGTLVPLAWIFLVGATIRGALTQEWTPSALVISSAGGLAFAFYVPFEVYWRVLLFPFASAGY